MITAPTWPTTKGLAPRLDPDLVRDYLQDELPRKWGAAVDKRMAELSVNGAQAAVLSGTTVQTISKIRAGELLPRDYLRVMLAIALLTTTEQLFKMPTLIEIEKAVNKRKRRVA